MTARKSGGGLLAAAAATMAMGACGGSDGKSADAAVDGPCGSEDSVTGAVVDWDSTDANFCGVSGAKLDVFAAPIESSATPPNGRITMCIPAHTVETRIIVTLPTGASQCPSLFNQPNNTYTFPAELFTTNTVLSAGGSYDVRLMTAGRVMTMFAGGAPAAGRGQLLVRVNGTPREVAISATHDTAQRFDGTSWAAGTTGADVFFPNIDLAGNPVHVTVTGGAIGTEPAFTLQPDKLTILSVIAN